MVMWLSTDRNRLPFLPQGLAQSKTVIVLVLQVRRTFQRHRPADMVVGGFDVLAAEAEAFQQVEGRIVQLFGRDAKRLRAELFAKRPLVEDEPDIEGARKCRFDLVQFRLTKAVADQRGVVDPRRVADGAVADGVGHDLFDLGRAIAKGFQRRRHRPVDDLEVAATGELLELHQREVRLDPRGVAIHDKANGARGRDHGGLGVAIAVLFAQLQRLVPGFLGQCDQFPVGAVGVIQCDGVHVHRLVAVRLAMGGVAVVADDAQHVLCVGFIFRERPKLLGDLGAEVA